MPLAESTVPGTVLRITEAQMARMDALVHQYFVQRLCDALYRRGVIARTDDGAAEVSHAIAAATSLGFTSEYELAVAVEAMVRWGRRFEHAPPAESCAFVMDTGLPGPGRAKRLEELLDRAGPAADAPEPTSEAPQ